MKDVYSLPCLYGVCFVCKKNYACSYVDYTGKTFLVSKREKQSLINHNYFFIRGLEYFFWGLYYFLKNAVKMPFFYKKTGFLFKFSNKLHINSKFLLFFNVFVFAILYYILALQILPISLACSFTNYTNNMFLVKFCVAVIKIFIVFLTLISLKFITCFRQFYRFNACINLITNKNRIFKPTNFLNFVITSFIISSFMVTIIGINLNFIFKVIFNFILCIFSIGITYEILYIMENCKYNFVNNICALTSFLITEKPTKTEMYIAMSAYSEVMFMKNKKRGVINNKLIDTDEVNFSSVYAESKEKLKSYGITDTSELDWLICEVLNISRSQLVLKRVISLDEQKQIQKVIERRIKGEPITKIFGRTEFYGYKFKVTKDVLSPRMETEILVEEALKLCKEKMNVLDMCTGSGIIAISMAKNVDANFTAVDISLKALNVAIYNAKINNVKINFKQSNLFENLKKLKKFDIIISNPPYIESDEIKLLDDEVKNYDPKIALDGGKDGLDFYRKIIELSPKYLTKSGYLLLEIGYNQADKIKDLLQQDFCDVKIIKDYNKLDRVVIAKIKR